MEVHAGQPGLHKEVGHTPIPYTRSLQEISDAEVRSDGRSGFACRPAWVAVQQTPPKGGSHQEIQHMKKLTLVLSALVLGACTPTIMGVTGGNGGNGPMDCDADNDGHNAFGCNDGSGRPSDDCDDNNAYHFPGAVEVCNGVDDNCNGMTDENNVCGGNPPPTDSDGDGDPDSTDCQPQNPNVHHGCVEVCGDGIDNNCSGAIDEGCNGNCGNPCNGGGGPMCTVMVKWTVSELIPTGPAYVFGGYNSPSTDYVDHWSTTGQCVPNAKGPLCALSQNGNVYTCSFEIESKTPLVLVAAAGQTDSQTGCMWSFDEGCWDGGGCSADNGLTQVYVEGIEQNLMQVPNPDAFPETNNGRVWVDCG
jgi:hypothetical protein